MELSEAAPKSLLFRGCEALIAKKEDTVLSKRGFAARDLARFKRLGQVEAADLRAAVRRYLRELDGVRIQSWISPS